MCPSTAVAEPGYLHLMNKTNRELNFLGFTFSNKLVMASEVAPGEVVRFQLQWSTVFMMSRCMKGRPSMKLKEDLIQWRHISHKDRPKLQCKYQLMLMEGTT